MIASGCRLLICSALLHLVSGPVAVWAAADAADCSATKMKGVGLQSKVALACHAQAAKKNSSVDAGCLAKSASKLTGAFAKAEAKGGCLTEGDAAAVSGDVADATDGIATALPVGADGPARRCSAAKRKAAAKKAKGFAKCYARAAKIGLPVNPACLGKADGKFVSAFERAESKGGCASVGDVAAIEGLVDAMIASAVADLVAVCGDGVAGPGEVCDGADDSACPGECTAGCLCGGSCGNGVTEPPAEECDDSGTSGGDGCAADCTLEDSSALCAGMPATPGTGITSELVVGGLDAPVHLTSPPLDPRRLFIVEQPGTIRVVEDGFLLPTPFLDIQDEVRYGGERGLLSLAFHPDYESNGRFFVNYSREPDGDTVVARYEVGVDPNVADESTEAVLLVINQPRGNHNGGQLAFDSNGFLYLGMGDSGGGGDPDEVAQDDGELLGKMLRLDVDVDSAPYYAIPGDNPDPGVGDPLGLIWAKGLRNPWRFSFDRANDDLYIADVGQNAWEEIHYRPGSSTGGENYGWDIFEASSCYEPDPDPDCPDPPTGFTFPVLEYGHGAGGGCSVTGGHVYRGCALPDLHGTYYYADYCTDFVRTFEVIAGLAVAHDDVTAAFGGVDLISSFGEDARGELYVMGLDGTVRRMIPAP